MGGTTSLLEEEKTIMELKDLFEMVDIENGAEFEYFENFADLVETEEEIESDLIYGLLQEVDLKVFEELTESYFYDTMENIPQEQIDLYNLMETIKRNFIGMAQAARDEDDSALVKLADELGRFINWYSIENNCKIIDSVDGNAIFLPVRDAIVEARLEKLGGHEMEYDFDSALDYPIEEYIMTYGDLVSEDE